MSSYSKLMTLLLCLGMLSSGLAQQNYINKGNAALKAGTYEEALSYYDLAAEHCDDELAHKNNTAILSALQGDSEAAYVALTSALDKDNDNPVLLYNRAVLQLNAGTYTAALEDLARAQAAGQKKGSKVKKGAGILHSKFVDQQVFALLGLAETAMDRGDYKEALAHYEAALALKPGENALLYGKAQAALKVNPYESLAAMEAVDEATLTRDQKTDLILVKAYSLGRINRMKEAIRMLEKMIAYSNDPDPKAKEMLGYYYLRLSQYDKAIAVLKYATYDSASPYVIAGNAALYSKKYSIAHKCFQNALVLDRQHLDAQVGLALSQAQLYNRHRAKQLIDSLAQVHDDNHYVMNTKGIIHKDLGLHYKNSFNSSRAKPYFTSSAMAFTAAGQINEHLLESFSSNRALALYFNDEKESAEKIWKAQKKMGSLNNLALLSVTKRKYRSAYTLLDSLSSDYYRKNQRKNAVLEHNRRLARNQERLNDNYRFVTYYFLHTELPTVEIENSFPKYQSNNAAVPQLSDFQLISSDKECLESTPKAKRKKKKRKRFKLFGKRKKTKKFEGQCPKF